MPARDAQATVDRYVKSARLARYLLTPASRTTRVAGMRLA